MARNAFFAGFFILFQSSTLANFGIGIDGVLLTFAGFMLAMMSLLSASLLIYCLTNGRPRRKAAVKALSVAMFVPLAAFLVMQYAATGDVLASAEAAVLSPWLRHIPIAGWAASGITALIVGSVLEGLLWLGAVVLLFAGMIAFIQLSNPDYYEDVLVATETAFEKKRAMAEGNVQEISSASSKAVRQAGFALRGWGAAALFGKHVKESFRENRFGFLNLASVLIIAGSVIVGQFVKDLGILLQILMWMQIFLIGTGRGLRETYSHYIFMIPEPSLKKMVWSNLEIVARTLIESVLIFGISGVWLQAPLLAVLACVFAYTLFSYLLLSVNYLSMRFTGSDLSTGIMLMAYYIMVVVAMLPGVVIALAAGFAIGGDAGFFSGMALLCAWELGVGTLLFALSRGVLHDCDMGMMKSK
jgi:hypothetical protein